MTTPQERRQNFGATTFMLVEEENGERKQARKAIVSPQAAVKLAATALFLPVLGLLLMPGVHPVEPSVSLSALLDSKFS